MTAAVLFLRGGGERRSGLCINVNTTIHTYVYMHPPAGCAPSRARSQRRRCPPPPAPAPLRGACTAVVGSRWLVGTEWCELVFWPRRRGGVRISPTNHIHTHIHKTIYTSTPTHPSRHPPRRPRPGTRAPAPPQRSAPPGSARPGPRPRPARRSRHRTPPVFKLVEWTSWVGSIIDRRPVYRVDRSGRRR